MNIRSLLRSGIAAFIATSLFACGGGSGGSDNGQTTDPDRTAQTVNFARSGPFELFVGESLDNPATGQSSGATIYSSSNEQVVTVGSHGKVIALAAGDATITADIEADPHYADGSASYHVKVLLRQNTLSFTEPGPISLSIRETFFNPAVGLSSGEISYTSSDNTVATVNRQGEVQLNGIGSAIITAEQEGDVKYSSATAQFAINVTPLQNTLTFLHKGSALLQVGQPFENPATGLSSASITYLSANDQVAQVDSEGTVNVLSPGTTTVSAVQGEDSLYGEASAQYTIETTVPMAAWIGDHDTKAEFPNGMKGLEFYRSTSYECGQSCPDGELDILQDAPVVDTTATTTHAAHYQLTNSQFSSAATISSEKFSPRSSHQVIEFKDRLWSIAGYDGELKNDIWSSHDGKSWRVENREAAFSARGGQQLVVFNKKIWLIGGYDGNNLLNDVWSSSDGKSWRLELPAAPFSPRTVFRVTKFKEKLWLVGGFDGEEKNDIWSSTDGTTWKLVAEHASFRPRANHELIEFQDKLWLIGGMYTPSYSSTIFMNDVWSSEDGLGWTEITENAPFPGREGHSVIVRDSKLWLIGGSARFTSAEMNDIWLSSDGKNWALSAEHAAFSPRSGHQAINFKSQTWLIGGSESSSLRNDIWSSRDMVTWRDETTDGNFSARVSHQLASHQGKLWLIGGQSFDGTKGDVWSSEDGTDWKLETANAQFSNRSDHQVISFDGRLWLIGGDDKDLEPTNDIWSSRDGINWTEDTNNAAFSKRDGHQVVVFKDKLWLIGGNAQVGGWQNDVWSSSDGINWSLETNTADFSPRKDHKVVVHDDKMWLIGGYDDNGYRNDIWSSADGIDWEEKTSSAAFPPTYKPEVFSFAGKLWLLGGTSANSLWSSIDGITWNQEVAGEALSARRMHKVAILDNMLYLTGGISDHYLRDVWKSEDALSWRKLFQGEFIFRQK